MIQFPDFSFAWHMQEYVQDHMKPITLSKGFLSKNPVLDDAYMAQVVSTNGKIGWLGGNGRPDLAAGFSIVSGNYRNSFQRIEFGLQSMHQDPILHNALVHL